MTTRKTKVAEEKATTWNILSEISCAEHVKQKGGLTYLPWAWAWEILKKNFPDASFEKHWFNYGDPTTYSLPYALDKQGNAFVKVTVTVDEVAVTEVLPVMNNMNRSVQRPDSFLVNTSLQRCLTKAIAYHGLGSYIYQGEDVPSAGDEAEEVAALTVEEVTTEISVGSPEIEPATEAMIEMMPTAAQPKDVAPSLQDLRDGFLGSGTASETESGVVVCRGKNLPGWKLVVECLKAFIPTIDDAWGDGNKRYQDGVACVAAVKAFYLLNKDVISALENDQKEMHDELIATFSLAKELANDGKLFTATWPTGVKNDAR